MSNVWSDSELAQLDYVDLTTTIAGQPVTVRSPGKCEITGDGIPRDWDVRGGFGLAGKTQVFRGLGLAEFQVKITLWDKTHRDAFENFDAAVEPSKPGLPERVYSLSNPRLAMRGISKAVFLNAPFLQDKGNGSEEVTYKLRQWRKPLATLLSTTAPGEGTATGRAADEFESRIADRTAVLTNRLAELTGP